MSQHGVPTNAPGHGSHTNVPTLQGGHGSTTQAGTGGSAEVGQTAYNPALPAGHSGEVYQVGAGGVPTTVLTNTYVTPTTANFGTVIFRPLEAKFTNSDHVTLHPYCKFKIGWHSGRSLVVKPGKEGKGSKDEGKHDKHGKNEHGHHETGQHGLHGQGTTGQHGQGITGLHGQETTGLHGQGTTGQYGQGTTGQHTQDKHAQYEHGKEKAKKLGAWAETVALPRKHNEQFAKLKVKDMESKDKNRLGTAQIPLADVVGQGRSEQWYPLLNKKNEVVGEIHLAMEYTTVLAK